MILFEIRDLASTPESILVQKKAFRYGPDVGSVLRSFPDKDIGYVGTTS